MASGVDDHDKGEYMWGKTILEHIAMSEIKRKRTVDNNLKGEADMWAEAS